MQMILVILVALSLWGGLHFWAGFRIQSALTPLFPDMRFSILMTVLLLLAMLYVVAQAGRQYLPAGVNLRLTQAGALWMGVMIQGLFALILVDLVRLIAWVLRKTVHLPSWPGWAAPAAGIVILGSILVLTVYGAWVAWHPVVKDYDVQTAKKAPGLEGLNIVMVSDIHIGEQLKAPFAETMADRINALNPDIILIPGDIIDQNIRDFTPDVAKAFSRLKAPYGVYACMGNHDYFGGGSMDQVVRTLEATGMKVLLDSAVTVDGKFIIAGREDRSGHRAADGWKRKTVQDVLAGTDPALPVILLDHQPYDFDADKAAGVDLSLHGHTHKGQFFPSTLLMEAWFPLNYGIRQSGSLTSIVTSGYGFWGPPLRAGATPEIVRIRMTFGK